MEPEVETVPLITASYTIPADQKARIERDAAREDLNASQVVRRILREHYARIDAASPEPAPEAA